ncbi:hypothetical protein [Natronobeatus ordinarius]|uniref:hypothetical protein n=1 Tax=Natronobeatus ordinarius TaxID=2963433 RepID=UPI0020CDAB96|nr:hypothetical protein [Natronobeatus ordinarius]
MKRRDDHRNGDLPKELERSPDLDDVPDDLIELLALEYIVRATCRNCGHSDYYVDTGFPHNEPDCKGASCSEQILLD